MPKMAKQILATMLRNEGIYGSFVSNNLRGKMIENIFIDKKIIILCFSMGSANIKIEKCKEQFQFYKRFSVTTIN